MSSRTPQGLTQMEKPHSGNPPGHRWTARRLVTDSEASVFYVVDFNILYIFFLDTVRSCVAKLFFSCPLKGHYCLYSKSSFTLVSRQPPLWIHIMFLFQQVRAVQIGGTSLLVTMNLEKNILTVNLFKYASNPQCFVTLVTSQKVFITG